MSTTHEFDAYCDTQDLAEPDYDEQLLVMQEFEEDRNAKLKRQGAIEALRSVQTKIANVMYHMMVLKQPTNGHDDALCVVNRELKKLLAQEGGAV